MQPDCNWGWVHKHHNDGRDNDTRTETKRNWKPILSPGTQHK